MSRPSLKEIKEISIRDRYYPYDTWIDYIFSPSSPYLAWLFIRLNISGNGVSWISGFTAIIGGILLANDSPTLIFIGSFGYMLFYQLDYVDGAVARWNKKGGVGGQYIDFIMHVISHIAIMSGLALGAISQFGNGIYPFAIIALVAAGLSHARHSMAWFAIVMEQQKRKAKGLDVLLYEPKWIKYKEPHIVYECIRKFSVLVFHESHLIFVLPLLAFAQLFVFTELMDFRVLLIIIAALVYFPMTVFEIVRLTNRNGVDEAYWKLFDSKSIPSVPDDHFFRAREKI
ncbi:CDP-alcohol phosphatidyltransferase family protein [Alphaproteobacteria bacterium]|nr:CDP-alcohol phosphatidyltransferase family protein [Alphaproteobacteria bacterium]